MTPAEFAAEYVFELHSDADMVARAADAAGHALRAGSPAEARERLREALRSLSLVEMRYQDALRYLDKAVEAAEATA